MFAITLWIHLRTRPHWLLAGSLPVYNKDLWCIDSRGSARLQEGCAVAMQRVVRRACRPSTRRRKTGDLGWDLDMVVGAHVRRTVKYVHRRCGRAARAGRSLLIITAERYRDERRCVASAPRTLIPPNLSLNAMQHLRSTSPGWHAVVLRAQDTEQSARLREGAPAGTRGVASVCVEVSPPGGSVSAGEEQHGHGSVQT